jgi:valyl-tRNA synthetase
MWRARCCYAFRRRAAFAAADHSFITEALWQHLPQTPTGHFVSQAAWPRVRDAASVSDAERALASSFDATREAVQAMNRVRSEYNVSPGARITATVIPVVLPMALLESQASTMGSIARADVTVSGEAPTALSASVVGRWSRCTSRWPA